MINLPEYILSDKYKLVFPFLNSNVDLPYNIKEGESCSFWFSLNDTARILKNNNYTGKIKLTASIADGKGKTYNTKKPIKFVIEEYI